MRLFVKYLSLPWATRATIHQVAMLLVLTRLALILLPYRVVRRWFQQWSQRTTDPRGQEYQDLLTWAGSGLGRYVLGDKPCLTQALVVQALLLRAGRTADLKIGVARDQQGRLRAHAWLVQGNRVILGGRRAPQYYATLSPLVDEDDARTVADSVAARLASSGRQS